ncbi:hypothetical protein PTNB85_09774 [Pyrenophora teres f. teres]|nr:hypothetical protein PTNB85_09774 [Pyrenophora teres f. teres]KAE8831554.1 hypothetical protein HRS9139_05796 [Pyrenophora teres f. teres]KAE8858611.1 hypothetical protein PTNB29_07826 [Pyrenophora teres f. teres]
MEFYLWFILLFVQLAFANGEEVSGITKRVNEDDDGSLCSTKQFRVSYVFHATRAISLACAGRCGALADCIENFMQSDTCQAFHAPAKTSTTYSAEDLGICQECGLPLVKYRCTCVLDVKNIENSSNGRKWGYHCRAVKLSQRIFDSCHAESRTPWKVEKVGQPKPPYKCPT